MLMARLHVNTMMTKSVMLVVMTVMLMMKRRW